MSTLLRKTALYLNTPTGFFVLLATVAAFVVVFILLSRVVVRKEYRGQFVVLATLVFVALSFFVMTFGFRKSGSVSADVVPRLWILGILACAVYLLVIMLRGTEDPDPTGGALVPPIRYILICLAYLLAMPYLGFFIGSVVFLVTGMLVLSYRKWIVILSVSAGWLAFSYLLFYRLLFVPLPMGKILEAILG
jgi:hypothetical protein